MITATSLKQSFSDLTTDVRSVASEFARAFVTLILFAFTGFAMFPIFLLITVV